MFKIISLVVLLSSLSSFGHVPRFKFLLENPQNIEHERGYFKGSFSVLKKNESLLGLSGSKFEKAYAFELLSVMPSEDFRLKLKDKNGDDTSFVIIDDFYGRWIKAVISSLVFNKGEKLLKLAGVEVTEDFDQEIVDVLSNYITESQKDEESEEKGVLESETALLDVSGEESDNLENTPLTPEDALLKRFYKKNESVSFHLCSFGPCYELSLNGVLVLFERKTLNIRYLQIQTQSDENEVLLNVSFDNFQKIGGRYNFPKNIIIERLNKKYLIKLESYYLSRRLPKLSDRKLEPLSLDQIFSI